MPTKSLDRLMFAQGGLCFFCKKPLPKSEASVEHLVASAHGGTNADDNCVACCKAVNALLGSMSLKEKLQVVLNQKGQFNCPNGPASDKAAPQERAKPTAQASVKAKDDKITLVIANLKQRGNDRPRTVKTLMSTITSLFPKGVPESDVKSLIHQLQELGKIAVTDNKVTYVL
jgi:HNH endonuclease